MESSNKYKAITIAIISFAVLHYALTIASNFIANNSALFLDILPYLNFLAFFLYVISGFLAGIIVKKQNTLIGLITGFLSAILAVIIFGVGSELTGILITVTSGFVLGGIGGALSTKIKGNVNNAL